MKLGTATNSVINHLHARGTIGQPTPVVGMGATILLWTDRHAGTIVSVETKGDWTYVGVQGDKAKVTAGSTHDGSASYEYSPNPKAHIEYFRAKGADGKWEQVWFSKDTNRWRKYSPGHGLRIGAREEYRDPHF